MEMKLTKEIGKEKFQIHIPMSKHNKESQISEAGKMMPWYVFRQKETVNHK